MKEFNLTNKVAVVTGALGLLGKHHCIALSEAGANVVVADMDENECRKFALELETRSIGLSINVTDKKSINEAFNKILAEYGKIDILVNNAAINDMVEDPKTNSELSRFENYPLEYWERSLNVNITGAFLCSQIFGKHMAEKRSGSIINIASTYGIVAPDQNLYKDKNGFQYFFKPPAYSVTKAALIALTKYLAAYWGEKGVRVNALSPGGVFNNQDEYFVEKYSAKTPLKRMAEPFDYKGAIVFLAGDASSYMTGTNLVIDGGWTCW